MDLSIIIVNWNSIEFLKACTASIRSTIVDLDYEIIVVDNASEAESCRRLSETCKDIKVICSNHNVGFARANNLGVEFARGEKILFLNPDTLVLKDAIRKMVLRLDTGSEIGAVGCRLLNGDLTLQTSCVLPFPTISNQLFAVDWLKQRLPTLPLWGMRALFAETPGGVYEVEVVSGACVMVRREVFEEIGQFSTDYFMYSEDTDLCCKIRRAGWKVCHVGNAHIVHFGGQSTKKKEDAFSDVVMRESVFRILRKFRGSSYAQLYRMALLLSAVARLMLLAPLLAIPTSILNDGEIRQAFRKWRRIAAWSLGLERWAGDLADNSGTAAVVARS